MASQVVPSPEKDGRRVLGDKTTNASWTTAKDNIKDSRPLIEKSLGIMDSLHSPKKLLSPSQKAGRKRTIDELEETGTKHTASQSIAKWPISAAQEKFRIFEDSEAKFTACSSYVPTSLTKSGSRVSNEGELCDGHDLPPTNPIMASSNGRSFTTSQLQGIHLESSIPSEPQARRLFVRQKAHLLRNRIQTVMRRVEGKSLDRKLSEYEAHRDSLFQHTLYTLPTLSVPLPSAAASKDTRTRQKKLLPPVDLREGPTFPQQRLSTPPPSAEIESPNTDTSTPRQQNYLRDPQTPTQPIQLSSPPETISNSEVKCPSRNPNTQPTSSENKLASEVH